MGQPGMGRPRGGARSWRILCAAIAAAAASAHAADLAPDQIALSLAWAHDIDFYDVGLVWELPDRFDLLKRNDVTVRLSADVAYWQAREQGSVTSLWDFSLTPLLRWSPPGSGSPRVFAEGGVGVHLLTHTQINYMKRFSTAFQFGECAALGLAFGPGDKFEIAAYVQHVSNGDIKTPNDGMTQGGVMVRLRLD
jgi:lipid A 3-O-deacylase